MDRAPEKRAGSGVTRIISFPVKTFGKIQPLQAQNQEQSLMSNN
jgi:hypothetical protein